MKGFEPKRLRDWIESGSTDQIEGMMEDVLNDVSPEELREFLEADLMDVPVDPEFKERLRQRLWDLVQQRARRRGDHS